MFYVLLFFLLTTTSIFPISKLILFLYNYLSAQLKLSCILVISIILYIEYKVLFVLYLILNKVLDNISSTPITPQKILFILKSLMCFWAVFLSLAISSDVFSNMKIEKYYSTDSIKFYFFILFSFLIIVTTITRSKIRYKIFISNHKMPIIIIDGESSLCDSHMNYIIVYYFDKRKGITHRQMINRDQITFYMQYY